MAWNAKLMADTQWREDDVEIFKVMEKEKGEGKYLDRRYWDGKDLDALFGAGSWRALRRGRAGRKPTWHAGAFA